MPEWIVDEQYQQQLQVALHTYCEEYQVEAAEPATYLCMFHTSVPPLSEQKIIGALFRRLDRLATEQRSSAFRQSETGRTVGAEIQYALREMASVIGDINYSPSSYLLGVIESAEQLKAQYERSTDDANGVMQGTVVEFIDDLKRFSD